MSIEPSSNAQLAKSSDIEYKAYARAVPDQLGDGDILYLLASCSYPVGQYHIFFEMDSEANMFNLMEIAPLYHDDILTYYVASFTSSFPSQWPDQITIIDAHGEHSVAVISWKDTAARA